MVSAGKAPPSGGQHLFPAKEPLRQAFYRPAASLQFPKPSARHEVRLHGKRQKQAAPPPQRCISLRH